MEVPIFAVNFRRAHTQVSPYGDGNEMFVPIVNPVDNTKHATTWLQDWVFFLEKVAGWEDKSYV